MDLEGVYLPRSPHPRPPRMALTFLMVVFVIFDYHYLRLTWSGHGLRHPVQSTWIFCAVGYHVHDFATELNLNEKIAPKIRGRGKGAEGSLELGFFFLPPIFFAKFLSVVATSDDQFKDR